MACLGPKGLETRTRARAMGGPPFSQIKATLPGGELPVLKRRVGDHSGLEHMAKTWRCQWRQRRQRSAVKRRTHHYNVSSAAAPRRTDG